MVETRTPAWPHAEHSRQVTVNGLRWQVQVMGQGPALWLLHGTGSAGLSWRDLLPRLASRCTVVVPDLPGHGQSAALPASAASMTGMARALAALAQALSLPPQAVVGHSAGAALALRACLDGGLAPRCLIGINAALLPFSGPARLVLPALARVLHHQPWLADRVADLVARRAADGAGLQRLVRSTGSTLDATGLALYGRLISDPAHVRGALAMMAHWDLDQLQRDLLRAVDRAASSQTPTRLPTLHLVTSARDATVPPRQARTLHDALAGRPGWDMHLHELPGLGHLAHEEAPGRLAELILSLLAV